MGGGGGADPSSTKKALGETIGSYSTAENLPEYNSVLVGCVTCSAVHDVCMVTESVEASMIQQKTFAWAAGFVHKRTLFPATG